LTWGADAIGTDSIVSSSWEFAQDPDGALNIDSHSNTLTTTTAWLSGGTLGQSYSLTNRIVTKDGRTLEQRTKIRVKAK
jgi:hypothetical protein